MQRNYSTESKSHEPQQPRTAGYTLIGGLTHFNTWPATFGGMTALEQSPDGTSYRLQAHLDVTSYPTSASGWSSRAGSRTCPPTSRA